MTEGAGVRPCIAAGTAFPSRRRAAPAWAPLTLEATR